MVRPVDEYARALPALNRVRDDDDTAAASHRNGGGCVWKGLTPVLRAHDALTRRRLWTIGVALGAVMLLAAATFVVYGLVDAPTLRRPQPRACRRTRRVTRRTSEAGSWSAARPAGTTTPQSPRGTPSTGARLPSHRVLDDAGVEIDKSPRSIPAMRSLASTMASSLVPWGVSEGVRQLPCSPLFAKDALLDGLRADRRFVSLLAKLKTDWEDRKRTLATR